MPDATDFGGTLRVICALEDDISVARECFRRLSTLIELHSTRTSLVTFDKCFGLGGVLVSANSPSLQSLSKLCLNRGLSMECRSQLYLMAIFWAVIGISRDRCKTGRRRSLSLFISSSFKLGRGVAIAAVRLSQILEMERFFIAV